MIAITRIELVIGRKRAVGATVARYCVPTFVQIALSSLDCGCRRIDDCGPTNLVSALDGGLKLIGNEWRRRSARADIRGRQVIPENGTETAIHPDMQRDRTKPELFPEAQWP